MSIASHFEQVPDESFVRAYDPRAAHRQFWISLVLLLVLSMAAFLSGMLFHSHVTWSPNALSPVKIEAPAIEAPRTEAPKARRIQSHNVAVAQMSAKDGFTAV